MSLVRRAVLFELRLYRSLYRWVTRRPVVAAGMDGFGYSRAVTPVIWLWIFASAVEMVVVHLLLPWPAARVVLLVLSAWGLIWMLGYLASLKVYPHLLGYAGLHVRHGATVDIAVPWDAIATIGVQRRDLPSSMRTLQPRQTMRGTDLQVGISGAVNVHVVLAGPLTVPTPRGDQEIAELSFWADEPGELVGRARQHLAGEAVTEQRAGAD